MSYPHTCPKCDQDFQVPDDWQPECECPKCKTKFRREYDDFWDEEIWDWWWVLVELS